MPCSVMRVCVLIVPFAMSVLNSKSAQAENATRRVLELGLSLVGVGSITGHKDYGATEIHPYTGIAVGAEVEVGSFEVI